MASTSALSVHRNFKYDVFLSFRGEDTRKNFVDHLYHALQQKGIETYKDDEKIDKGEIINEQLLRSIEESRFYIIVLSKNYASSSWCLNELAKIMECQRTAEHTAYPVFYDVEPTEVRNQSGAVGVAFAKHVRSSRSSALPMDILCSVVTSCCNGSSSSLNERTVDTESEDDVGRWRKALKEAAALAGLELKNTFNGHEAQFIQKIVQEVSLKLHFINPSFDGTLVGMETRVNDIVTSLELDSNDVRMIGIKGMGGGGKTTLARAVYDHISVWFDSKSFVENVRENSKGSGLKDLQKQILSAVDQNIVVTGVLDGTNTMKRRMGTRKALIVLDDVDHIDQLEALVGKLTWFKPGSRIIITTRDEQVLVAHGVHSQNIRDVNLLSNEEAIRLFSRCAFKREVPSQNYEELSRKVVHYASGLPLTIRVLGSFLNGRSERQWEDAIERLKTIPLKETLEKLEISYDGLENDYKEIFLEVACILRGKEKGVAIRVLESLGFHAEIGLGVLEQKSLLTLSYHWDKHYYLQLHDHIEEMGMNIVRRLYPNDPNRHSRLWIKGEIEEILVNESARFKLICKVSRLNLGLAPHIEEKNLVGCNDFVELNMQHECSKLIVLCLSGSKLKTFDLLMTPNLEKLYLEGCNDLVELNMQLECPKLKVLYLNGSKLKTFDLRMTPNIEELHLGGCNDFVELYMPYECQKLQILDLSGSKVRSLNLGLTPHIEKLDLNGCYNLKKIHDPLGCLKRLAYLDLNGCLWSGGVWSVPNIN